MSCPGDYRQGMETSSYFIFFIKTQPLRAVWSYLVLVRVANENLEVLGVMEGYFLFII